MEIGREDKGSSMYKGFNRDRRMVLSSDAAGDRKKKKPRIVEEKSSGR